MDSSPLLTLDDLARLLKVRKRTISRWLASGRSPEPIRCSNRSLRRLVATVLRWLEDQRDQTRREER